MGRLHLLSKEEVILIRVAYARGVKQTYIATKFGVTQGTVSRIVQHKGYKEVEYIPKYNKAITKRLESGDFSCVQRR